MKVVSGQEDKIKLYLDSEVMRNGLSKYVLKVLVPYEKVFEICKGKRKNKKKNFFPGYILIYANLFHGEVIHVIKKSPGVLNFLNLSKLENSSNLESIRQSEMNKILSRLDKYGQLGEKSDNSFIIDETVKIIDGPFNGSVGSVKKNFKDRKKLNVIVKVFGRNIPIELNYIQVEKLF
ncbi:MAG: transcription termination/antitermination NusG family protein [Cytophagales bacterium]